MIRAWRLIRRDYVGLSGEGPRRYGGRWSRPGFRVVYWADHPALAVLEVRVHLDLPPSRLPEDYVMLAGAQPDEPPEVVSVMPDHPEAVGEEWLRSGRTAVLAVPTAIVPAARNFLLNPLHPRAAEARIVETIPFRFDPRLWSGVR